MDHQLKNGKAPGACNTEGFDTDSIYVSNSATETRNCKAIATQIAEFALAGYAVDQLLCGVYLVGNHKYKKYCHNFAELQELARTLGVKHVL